MPSISSFDSTTVLRLPTNSRESIDSGSVELVQLLTMGTGPGGGGGRGPITGMGGRPKGGPLGPKCGGNPSGGGGRRWPIPGGGSGGRRPGGPIGGRCGRRMVLWVKQ